MLEVWATGRVPIMSLPFQILGSPTRDNALFVRVESGQALHRLLFDCGEACLYDLPPGEVEQIDHLFFSHLHMDHVCGFDTFFRANFSRAERVHPIWGPPGTAVAMHHRFQGYTWNLIKDDPGTWLLHDLDGNTVTSIRCELHEKFTQAHALGDRAYDRVLLDRADFRIESVVLDHGTLCLGYIVREPERVNIDTAKLAALALPPGPWLKAVRGPLAPPEQMVSAGGRELPLRELQGSLLVRTQGDSLAYLTDFCTDDLTREQIAAQIRGVDVLVCESQYLQADEELAVRNHHMTTRRVGELAVAAGVGRLVLFHISGRYLPEQWPMLLHEVKAIFPATSYPDHWKIQ